MTRPLRGQVADIAQHLHTRGWVANHDGNVTARDGAQFVATPTATSKHLVGERSLITSDAKGQVVGSGKVFGEIGLHVVVYARRPDVGAVVHAHPPYATAIAARAATRSSGRSSPRHSSRSARRSRHRTRTSRR